MKTGVKILASYLLVFALTGCAPNVTPTAPANNPAPHYTIIAGDVLQITVWKEDALNQEVLVLPDGTINYPLIGAIPAQGKTPAELQDYIKDKLSKLIPDAPVTVSVKAALGHTVSVIGQVAKKRHPFVAVRNVLRMHRILSGLSECDSRRASFR